jgi:hypothetical protein
MRKAAWITSVILGLSLLLVALPALAQWGAIQSGADALKRGKEAEKKPEPGKTKASEGTARMDDKVTGVSTAPVTYQNKARSFSYTIPAGWRLERGDPSGNEPIFMKPGSTCGFTMHINQMVPSFPRKSAVDAGYKQSMEEKTINKYMAVKRRNQGANIIGWETIETAEKGSGGFQRIQWNCYDGQNYMYAFMAHCEPKDFNANRAQLQGIIDSIRFSK